jgi:ParB/RepB/Spo0J family partition protein
VTVGTPTIKRNRELKWLKRDKIIPNEKNPRQKAAFSPEMLAPLRASIEELGILEPLMVQPYRNGMFKLLEGERRWTVAGELGIQEMPAVIVNRLDEQEQVVTMFNIHHQRKGWEAAEELTAIRELKENNGHLTDVDLAKRLGISLATLRDRLTVLALPDRDKVIMDIAREKVDYSSVLRSINVAKSVASKRPSIAEKLGGEAAIREHLIEKAKARRPGDRKRGGIGQELVEARKDLVDPEAMPDDLVEEYITTPDTKLRDVRRKTGSLEERRKVEDLAREAKRLEREMAVFKIDLGVAPNLRELRLALAALIQAAQSLELQVSEAIFKQEEEPGR